VTATKSGKVTTIEVDGTAIAAVNDGADAEDTRVIAVAIPAVVRVLTGNEFNIYYANVISQQNAMFWCSAANGLTIKRYGDHLSITANAPGTYPLQWKVYDSGYSLLASGTCMIIAAANKAVTASALVIGDSTVTQGNYICQKLLQLLTAPDFTKTNCSHIFMQRIHLLICFNIAMSKTPHTQYLCRFARHGTLFYHSKWYN